MTELSSLSKLVRFAEFPEVITLGPVAELKARLRAEGDSPARATEAELRALLELYFIDDPDNRRAWEAVIGSIARAEGPGRGFLISGAYGAGKSHMLAALSLLAEHPQAWNHFVRGHPWMRRFARAFGPGRKLVAVEIPLDHYRGGVHALESIVFRRIEDELRQRMGDDAPALVEETAYLGAFERLILPQRSAPFKRFLVELGEDRQWELVVAQDRVAALRLARRFMHREGIEVAAARSRGETLERVREAMAAAGLGGLVLLIDELSLFLASKDKRGLDEDASFLQFLAQQVRAMPWWVIAATQRDLEDVGDIDSHSLRQIRDRYESHHLSLAQLRTVIERKLVEKPDPHAFAMAIREACEGWAGDGRLSFTADELARTYPFNPLALDAFQGAAQSFLSQTRSVVQAVGRARASGVLEQGPRRLVSADAAFDLAAERLAGRPELAWFEAARRFYSENAGRISRDQPALVVAAFEALALAALAGARWTVREIGDALAGSPVRDDRAADFYPRLHSTLKAMRRRGAYVECLAQAGDLTDQYYLELSSDVGEALRRRLYEVMDALDKGDSRIFEHAAAACEDAAFPLALFRQPGQQQFEWMNTVRRATVERRDMRLLRPEELSRLADALSAPGTAESGWLVIGDMREVDGQREAWLAVAAEVAGRWTRGLVAWLPRPLQEEEVEVLREHAALRMLAADPTAHEGEHGRELAARVAERLAAQAREAARIVAEAYLQGELLRADGRRSDAEQLSGGGERWEDIVGGIFDWPLRELFPRFREVAPRKRLAGKQRSTFVIEEFLRPGRAAPPPDSALEEALGAYVEPLGLARREDGQWELAVGECAAARAVLESVPARPAADALDAAAVGAPTAVARFADCAAGIEKSEWGVTPEMVELVIGALVRAGHVVALDGFLKPIPFSRLGTPLSDHISYLARAMPLSPEEERGVLTLSRALFGEAPERLDCESQNEMWGRLCDWARETSAHAPEVAQRLASLYEALGQGPAEWAESRRALAAAEELAGVVQPEADARDGLCAVAHVAKSLCDRHPGPQSAHRPQVLGAAPLLLEHLAPLLEFLREDAEVTALMFRYLNDDRLRVADAELARLREEMLAALTRGETIIRERGAFRKQAAAFVSEYAERYHRHHAETYSVARFRPYADLRRRPEFRALLALAPLGLAVSSADLKSAPPAVGAPTAVEAKLRAQMERHCAGGRLHQALRRQPTCPDCGLALGDNIELIAPDELLADCRGALGAVLGELARRRDQVEAALEAERDSAKARALRRALEVPADAAAEVVLDAFTSPVIEWLAAALRPPTGARLRLTELDAFLRGRRLTREQALRAFGEWLSAHGAAGDGDTVEFE